jgi:hypothetical protein
MELAVGTALLGNLRLFDFAAYKRENYKYY